VFNHYSSENVQSLVLSAPIPPTSVKRAELEIVKLNVDLEAEVTRHFTFRRLYESGLFSLFVADLKGHLATVGGFIAL
jgi:hypothetical protein